MKGKCVCIMQMEAVKPQTRNKLPPKENESMYPVFKKRLFRIELTLVGKRTF